MKQKGRIRAMIAALVMAGSMLPGMAVQQPSTARGTTSWNTLTGVSMP